MPAPPTEPSVIASAERWRLRGRRPLEWLLLTGDRLVVSAALLVVVALAVGGVVAAGVAPLTERTPMLYLLFALISGNFVLITIVVSLSQFVLARHLESPDEIRRRMNEMLGYRREVGESTRRSVLPVTPSGFLEVLFEEIARLERELVHEIPAVVDGRAQDELTDLTEGLEAHASHVSDLLADVNGSLEDALFATLNTSYATYIYLAYHLESEHADALTPGAADLLPQLVRGLEQVDVARRFFKTVFIQSELSTLSRRLLYIGLPVQLATVVLMLLFTAPPAAGLGPATLALVIPTIVVAGFAPIVILTAYILRLSVVAQRTAAMYPFTDDWRRIAPVLDDHRWAERTAAGRSSDVPGGSPALGEDGSPSPGETGSPGPGEADPATGTEH